VTYQRPQDERHNYDEAYVRARIVGALGGRAAEELVYGDRSSGAESDLEHATELARQMVTRWGMSNRLGPVTLAPRDNGFLGASEVFGLGGGAKPYSEATAELVDAEIRRILQECHGQAAQLLAQHRAELDTLAQALLDHETLDEQQILQVTGLPSAPRLAPRRVPIASGAPEPVFAR
jgi:cell division protease FtsH